MRIISGKYKIRTLPPPKGFGARPTTDFAKENLFNVIKTHYDLEDNRALDLFSGTGSISLELASNGCEEVLAVESNPKHIAYIKSIIEHVHITEIKVIRADAFKFLGRCTDPFDFIFADPPYQLQNILTLPDTVFSKQLLKPGGLFILEHSASHSFTSHPNFKFKKVYGSVNFSFFEEIVT